MTKKPDRANSLDRLLPLWRNISINELFARKQPAVRQSTWSHINEAGERTMSLRFELVTDDNHPVAIVHWGGVVTHRELRDISQVDDLPLNTFVKITGTPDAIFEALLRFETHREEQVRLAASEASDTFVHEHPEVLTTKITRFQS